LIDLFLFITSQSYHPTTSLLHITYLAALISNSLKFGDETIFT